MDDLPYSQGIDGDHVQVVYGDVDIIDCLDNDSQDERCEVRCCSLVLHIGRCFKNPVDESQLTLHFLRFRAFRTGSEKIILQWV